MLSSEGLGPNADKELFSVQAWKQAVLALQLLTVLPLPPLKDVSRADLGRSMRFYPLVGLGLGGMSAGLWRLLSPWIPGPPAATLALVLLVLISGALHLDGFADMCDGFYKGRNKAEILEIMKDSHAGAMAVVGMVCLFALKLSFLWSLPAVLLPRTLILMPAAGRWTMVLLAGLSPYARAEGGTAENHVNHAGFVEVAIAAVSVLSAAWLILHGAGVLVLAGVTLFALIFRRYVMSKIGGVTGDVLGGCGEVSECVFLLGVCVGMGGA